MLVSQPSTVTDYPHHVPKCSWLCFHLQLWWMPWSNWNINLALSKVCCYVLWQLGYLEVLWLWQACQSIFQETASGITPSCLEARPEVPLRTDHLASQLWAGLSCIASSCIVDMYFTSRIGHGEGQLSSSGGVYKGRPRENDFRGSLIPSMHKT